MGNHLDSFLGKEETLFQRKLRGSMQSGGEGFSGGQAR